MADDPILSKALPQAPVVAKAARDAALAAAMSAYDKAHHPSQGSGWAARLMGWAGMSPAPHGNTIMKNRYRWAMAASALAGAAAIWVVVGVYTPPVSRFQTASWEITAPLIAKPKTEVRDEQPRIAAIEKAPPADQDVVAKPPAPVMAEIPAPATQPAPPAQPAERRQSLGLSLAPPKPAGDNSAIASRGRMATNLAPDAGAGGKIVMDQPRLTGYHRDNSAPAIPEPPGRDQFQGRSENPFHVVAQEPVSTFSLDVDTASYSFTRASLARNLLPQRDAVRTEELVNYFPYDYPAPGKEDGPFKTTVSVFPSPWNAGRQIVHIGIKGAVIGERPKANLVFLIDTSGSMSAPNRLPLAKQALSMLVQQLGDKDVVGIVTYAGEAGIALQPTSDKAKILAAVERLNASGSTAGAEGIRQAYALAEANFDADAVNRIVLATDGDFNVGITSREELKSFIERKRETGIFLSVLGFGMGNYNDALMQALAQNGNGVAAYIDTLSEARKTLVDEATSMIVPIAKDVKVQVEFNPARVAEYRLVGYEKRVLRREDFNNDKVDAGEVGSGHAVTAIYEITPVGSATAMPELRYRRIQPAAPVATDGELGYLSMRYKLPKEETSRLMTVPIRADNVAATFEAAPQDARFSVAVAGFGELLRGGRYTGHLTYDDVIKAALDARGQDPYGYRSEFVQMVRTAKTASAMDRPNP